MRFDVPVVGPTTIKSCREAGVETIAVEAGKTLILGANEMKKACEEAEVSLVGVS